MTPPTPSRSAGAPSRAGRELDALVAEHVMGWVWRRSNATRNRCLYQENRWPEWMDQPADGTEPLVGDWYAIDFGGYSTNIAAAWLVVEAMHARGLDFEMRYVVCWTAEFYTLTANGEPKDADTAPLAICLAALTATEPPDAHA